MSEIRVAALSAMGWLAASSAAAQTVLDRADPAARAQPRQAEEAPAAPAVKIETDTPAASVNVSESGVMVGAVRFTGLQDLAPADFADVVEPFLGKSAPPAALAELAGKTAARARARGYVFASASIEPQSLSAGVLTITMDEGRIDEVRLDGPDQPAARAALAPLVSRRPVTLAQLERRLLLAGDIDGVWVRSSRYLRENGRGVLLVKLGETPLAGRIAVTNDGTRPIGPDQIYLRFDANQLLFADDALTLAYSGALAEPEEYMAGRIRYAKRVSPTGTELALSGSLSGARPGAYLTPLDIRGRTWSAALSALQPLHRRRATSLWLTGDFVLRDSEQTRRGLPARADRTAVARLGVRGFTQVGGGRLRGGATLSQGLDLFGATKAGDPLASRSDADGVFTSLFGWTEWTAPIAGGLSVRAGVEGQVADGPLLVSEEVGLGGTSYLRGYDWSERSGDQGVTGMLELRYDLSKPLKVIRRAQIYGFIDGGHVSNLASGFGSGGLASAGGGIRADVTRSWSASVEIAAPLSARRYETGDRSPRINLAIGKTF